jgi:hypothetical protein
MRVHHPIKVFLLFHWDVPIKKPSLLLGCIILPETLLPFHCVASSYQKNFSPPPRVCHPIKIFLLFHWDVPVKKPSLLLGCIILPETLLPFHCVASSYEKSFSPPPRVCHPITILLFHWDTSFYHKTFSFGGKHHPVSKASLWLGCILLSQSLVHSCVLPHCYVLHILPLLVS